MLVSIGARFLEDLDVANTLGKLWTVAGKTLPVLDKLALGLLVALVYELALDGEIMDGSWEVCDSVLGPVVKGDTFQISV